MNKGYFISLFDADLSEGLRWGWSGSLGEIKAKSIPYLWVILTVDQSEVSFDKR